MTERCRAAVEPSPVAGNGLFASEDIGEGELIFRVARPLVGVLDLPRLADTCSYCFRSCQPSVTADDEVQHGLDKARVSLCTGCRAVGYCSKVRWKSFSFVDFINLSLCSALPVSYTHGRMTGINTETYSDVKAGRGRGRISGNASYWAALQMLPTRYGRLCNSRCLQITTRSRMRISKAQTVS